MAARGAASYKMLFSDATDKVALTLPGSGKLAESATTFGNR